ncbi:MAG: hypothetical protein B5M54_04735 [Candidatus Aminicenantes bacterium 4484_214]|nr:MAG: hypothetical protein B5M54_04735 [Candidatus Aminicenantes bacterium 4484_214]
MSGKGKHQNDRHLLFWPISLFEDIPGLISGFGTRYLTKKKLESMSALLALKLVFIDQIHSDKFRFIDSHGGQLLAGDALITGAAGLLLCVRTADCLPVLIVEPKTQVIAAVHCGWRGTAQQLLLKVVNFMINDLRCAGEDLLFAFGPRICGHCYEVGQEVKKAFANQSTKFIGFHSHRQGERKWNFDLLEANLAQLREAGVNREQTEVIDQCTYHHSDWWSYRKNGLQAGRLFNFIGWRTEKA